MRYDFDTPIDRRNTGCAKWDTCPPGVIPLPVADMDFRSPEPVIQAMRDRVEHRVFGYPLEPQGLREVILARLEARYGWRVAPEALVFLPGVIPGFNVACRATSIAGEAVMTMPPVYPPIMGAPANHALRRLDAPLVRGDDGHYEIDWDATERWAPEARLLLLCSPHNPVGRVFTRAELEHLADLVLRHDLFVCSDEIHSDLLLPGQTHTPIASISPEIGARCITLMAPSKTFNIAGVHFAFAVIEEVGLRNRFLAARSGIMGNPDIMGYTAAHAAYLSGDEWLQQVLEYLGANHTYLSRFVQERLPMVHLSPMEGTYLGWLDCRELNLEQTPARFFLEEAGVALSEGAAYGPSGAGFVRLNFGCTRATLEEALERMARAVERLT